MRRALAAVALMLLLAACDGPALHCITNLQTGEVRCTPNTETNGGGGGGGGGW